MIIFEACLVVLAVEALIFRGRLARLAQLRIRRFWLVWLALIDQLVVISVLPGGAHLALSVANFASYLAAAAFVWFNRRVPGIVLIAIGGACNIAAIAANHGTMPASETALRASGWKPAPGHFVNSAHVAHAQLAWLGDVFSVPRWIPGHTVFSAGDVIAVAGIAVLVALTARRAPVVPSVSGSDGVSRAAGASAAA